MTLEETLARAIADGFWETAEQPRLWASMGENQRQVFRICAVRAIAAGKAFREARAQDRAA
jgi:hypothetical protein